MNNIEKVIRDRKVAVLYSPGFGAGWSSWNHAEPEILLFHPKIVQMVEEKRHKEITESWMEENFKLTHVYCGGAKNLEIKWLPVGTIFRIDEYDGNESIITKEEDSIFIA